jgi:hypothetical protein
VSNDIAGERLLPGPPHVGAARATFRITTRPVSTPAGVSFSAMANGATGIAVLRVTPLQIAGAGIAGAGAGADRRANHHRAGRPAGESSDASLQIVPLSVAGSGEADVESLLPRLAARISRGPRNAGG